MWIDAEANFERFSHKDSIDYYLEKSNRWALHMRLSTFARSQEKFYIKVSMLRK